ncbi:uncharacterized protein [Anabrus simplex]|uniref:uncharacterized protein n=1 Tax=Anabrus simplex TaxID=316456 RepID=UPI0035A3BAB7
MPEEKCLCLFPLRTGAIIIGVVFMIVAVLDAAFCIYRIDYDEDLDRFHNVIWTARISDWIGELINFILSGLLIYGVIKNEEKYLVWWIWYIGIMSVVVGTVILGAILMFFAFQMNIEATVFSIVLIAATLLIVHSLRTVQGLRILMMEMTCLPHVMLSKTPQPTTNNDLPKKDSPPRYIPLK